MNNSSVAFKGKLVFFTFSHSYVNLYVMQKIHTINNSAKVEKERNCSGLGWVPGIKRIFLLH